MLKKFLTTFIMSGAAAMLFPACNGIFSDIYDEASSETISEYGFLTFATESEPGSIYIDATDYTKWVYIDFTSKSIDVRDVNDEAPAQWDLAVHRYDTKTNNGAVMETGATGFYSLANVVKPDTGNGEYVKDIHTTDVIVTDMSTMMDGYLSYAESDYNTELSKWLNVDKSSMPPVYTPSNKVYILRLNDGSTAAIRLDNYMDAIGVKGYMTIQYMYPLNL
ncbi:MAG: hypothetical protein HFJ95_09055 [Muribaculaceae bacterium]|jgi:hypothetical protein|nr:hypothetical protein [Muribaculaceae bacterium]